jgi:hypothetical protein
MTMMMAIPAMTMTMMLRLRCRHHGASQNKARN